MNKNEFKNKLIELFIKGLEKRCLGKSFTTTIFLSGVGLVSTNYWDFLSNILGFKDEKYQIYIGLVLMLLAIIIYFSERLNGEKSKKRHKNIQGKNKGLNKNSIIPRKEMLIMPRISMLLMVLGLIILILSFGIIICNITGGLLGLWLALVFLSLVTPICRLGGFIYNLKNKKLLILNKKYNLEYGNDGNIYLTNYDFTCDKCSQNAYINFNFDQKYYYLQCKEYEDHKCIIDISEFDKFSNP